MSRPSVLLPTGVAAEVLPQRRARLAAHPAFPREWLAGASAWEEGPAMLHLCWELSRCAPEAEAAESRALMLLAFAALAGLRQGSTRVPVRGERASELHAQILGPLGASEADRTAVAKLLAAPSPSARALLGGPADFAPLILDGDWLCTQRVRALETRLVEGLLRRLEGDALCDEARAHEALGRVAAPRRIALSDEQKAAVQLALQRPLSAIAGGPGTGKTSVVATLVRALARLGLAPNQIALAAPTGKAAARMDQAVRDQLRALEAPDALDSALLAELPPARTLHRLLRYSPARDGFLHHAQNPLAEEAVVVDESSMIDLFLMERLESAVKPGARLVLLGDAEQLPSVDAGAVFRDLLPSTEDDRRARGAVRLTRSYRMDPADPAGRNVLTVANAVRLGELPAMQAGGELGERVVRVREKVEELDFEGVEQLACAMGDGVQRALLDHWHRARHPAELEGAVRHVYRFVAGELAQADRDALERLFAHAERARLLCVTRGRDLAGVAGVNAYLHQMELAAWRARGERLSSEAPFLPGEPVVVEQNDYARGLFNGDAGLVVRGSEASSDALRWIAVFRAGSGFRAFPLDGLRGLLELAHATTVHKAQGAELDQVALLLPGRDLPLFSRELIYTAVTRARRSALLVGGGDILARGIARGLARHSGIGERLRGPALDASKTGSEP